MIFSYNLLNCVFNSASYILSNCSTTLLQRPPLESHKTGSCREVVVGERYNIGIKHGFSCINIHQVLWKVLKSEARGLGFQHLPRDLANVNALKNHV